MAERRMFAKSIVDSDAFLDMPMSARLLYYDLGMRADDDGFINSPKKIMRMIGATSDDMNILILRKFIIPFDSGVVVIKAWRINNYLRSDRYKETNYIEELNTLEVDKKGMYHQKKEDGIPDGIPTVSTGKDSIGKDSIVKDNKRECIGQQPTAAAPALAPVKDQKHIYGEFKHVKLTDTEYQKLITEYGEIMTQKCITFLDEYIERKGYKAKSHYLCIRSGWVLDAVKERERKSSGSSNRVAEQLEESYRMMAEWSAKDGE